jgi:hypothetical protein
MRAAAILVATLALAVPPIARATVGPKQEGMIVVPTGSYVPFLREKA